MQRRLLVLTSDDDEISSFDEFVNQLGAIVHHTPYEVEHASEADLSTLFGSAHSSGRSPVVTIEVTFTPTEPCTFQQALDSFSVFNKAFQIKSVGFGGEDKEWRALFEVEADRMGDVCTVIDNTELFEAQVVG